MPQTVFFDLDEHKNNSSSLAKHLKRFKINISYIGNTDITVGGEFDEIGYIYINIFGDFDNFEFTDDAWVMFKFRLIQCIMHELIHWHQFDTRGHGDCKVLKFVSEHPDAKYYSSVDEISAYSHCIVLELRREYPEMSINESLAAYGGETYDYIFNTIFMNNYDNLALKRYEREIKRWEKVYEKVYK